MKVGEIAVAIKGYRRGIHSHVFLLVVAFLVVGCQGMSPTAIPTATQVEPTPTPTVEIDENRNCLDLWALREYYAQELAQEQPDPEIGPKLYAMEQGYAEAFEERCAFSDVLAEAQRRADAGKIPVAPQLSDDPRSRWAQRRLGWEWAIPFDEWGKSLIPAELVQVINGDTICVRIRGDQYNVQLIGIDAPGQGQCGAEYAKTWLEELLTYCEGNCSLYLERDESETDRYTRLLRYVWVHDDLGVTDVVFFEGVGPVALYIDGYTFVNLEMVAAGAAFACRYPPDMRYVELLEWTEQYARIRGEGIWTWCR